MFTPDYPQEEIISVEKLTEILSNLDKSQFLKINSSNGISVYSSMAFETGGTALGHIKIGEERYEPIKAHISEF